MDSDTWSKENDKYSFTAGDRFYEHIKSGISAKGSRIRSSKSLSGTANFNSKDRSIDVEAQNLQNTGHFSDEKISPSISMFDTQKPTDTAGDKYKDMLPTISFNIHNGSNSKEVTICAVIAIGLQIGVLV